MPLVNGDFESGQLGPWAQTFNPHGAVSVQSEIKHSGNYALLIQGPGTVNSQIDHYTAVSQVISPLSTPLKFIGYMYNLLLPGCNELHPYNAFQIGSTYPNSPGLEFGIQSYDNYIVVFFAYGGAVAYNAIAIQRGTQWVKFELNIYPDHADLFVTDEPGQTQKVGTIGAEHNFFFQTSTLLCAMPAATGKRSSTTCHSTQSGHHQLMGAAYRQLMGVAA